MNAGYVVPAVTAMRLSSVAEAVNAGNAGVACTSWRTAKRCRTVSAAVKAGRVAATSSRSVWETLTATDTAGKVADACNAWRPAARLDSVAALVNAGNVGAASSRSFS